MPQSIFLGTGRALPERVVTNHDLAQLMDTSDEWIRQRTGIEERRWVREGETGSALGLAASRQALAMAGLEPAGIDAIVYATCTPDHFLPGNGCYLQRDLGAGPIPAIDIRAQCSGFVYGLSIADAWIRSGMYRTVLVVGQEIQSTGMQQSTEGRNTAVIFADGAGAAILGASDEPGRGLLAFDLHADGDYAEKLWVDIPGSMHHPRIPREKLGTKDEYLQMDGQDVFRHAVVRMPESTRTALAKAGLEPKDISLLVPHQANLRISEMVQKSLGLGEAQVANNIQRYGNTTAATIPILLDECVRAGRVQRGDLVVLTAFGSGFMWGSCVVRW